MINFNKILCLLLLNFLLFSFSAAQTNLVHNPGFENITSGFNCPATPQTYGNLVSYWNNCSPWTVPAKHNFGCYFLGQSIGTPDVICFGGNFQPHYGRTVFQEYITAPLVSTLQQGKQYYVQFYYKAETNSGNCGIKFFENRPEQCSSDQPIISDGPASVSIPFVPNGGWQKFSGYYTAEGYYDWIALGVFNTSNKDNSGPGMSFDDFQIYEVGPNECPPYNSIQNWTFENIGEITFRSSQITISGTMVDNQKTYGDVVVKPTGIVTFKSETEVVIAPEFSAEYGSEFRAIIRPCANDCYPASVSAGADINACNNAGGQYTLGSGPANTQTYAWAVYNSTVPNAENFLSATNVANPVFTAPSGTGLISYVVTATNECGETASDIVVIGFDDNPSGSTPANLLVNNINSNTDYISFDISGYNASTSAIYVEFTDEDGNQAEIYQIENPYAVYGSNGFNWTMPDYISNCHQYTINVYAENYCNHTSSITVVFNWNPPTTPVITLDPNVFSPNCSPPNDVLEFQVNSASKFTVYVYTNSGSLIYKKVGEPFSPPFAPVWDGTCNTFSCNAPNHCGNLDIVGDGTYYVVVTFSNDCDPATTVSVAHDVELFGPGARRNMHLDSADTEINAGNAFSIFPNPSHESFTITSADLLKGGTLRVVNMLGQEVHKEQIAAGNSSTVIKWNNLANGVYYLEFVNEQTKTVKRIIKE